MFDWQTDGEWDDDDTAVKEAPPLPPDRSRQNKLIAAGLLVVIFVLLAAGLVYGQLNREVTAVTDSVESQLGNVYLLLLETAVAADDELFQALVSDYDVDWLEIQTTLLQRDLMFNRGPLGLWLDEAGALQGQFETAVTLNPELTKAEQNVTLPYLTLSSAGTVQPIRLQQMAIFEKKNDTWLLTEPDSDFWGSYVKVTRPFITVATPERDAALAERLADDLNDLVERVCDPELADCAPDFNFGLRLDNEADSFTTIYPQFSQVTTFENFQRSQNFNLPALSLVGLPVDEAAYEAILRGYGAHVAQAILLNSDRIDATSLVSVRPGREELEPTLVELGLFYPWPPGYHPLREEVPPPHPLPELAVALQCWRGAESKVLIYDLQTERSEQLFLVGGGIPGFFGTPMPDGRGLLMSVTLPQNNERYTVWLNDGQVRRLEIAEEAPLEVVRVLAKIDPGLYLILYAHFDYEAGDPINTAILDEAACTNTDCPLVPVESIDIASPDGRYRLLYHILAKNGPDLELEDASGETLLHVSGVYPAFWLDEDTLGYVRFIDNELVISEIEGDQVLPRTQVDARDLSEVGAAAGMSVIRGFTVIPPVSDPPEHLVLLTFAEQGNQGEIGTIFSYDWQNDRLKMEAELSGDLGRIFVGASPDGRYLNLIDTFYGSNLTVFDLKEKQWQNFALQTNQVNRGMQGNFLWSQDDAWLLLVDNDTIRLISPTQDYEKKFFPGQSLCSFPTWIEWP